MQTKSNEELMLENSELKHLINQFKNLLDSIPDPVFMKDENLRWIYGNPVILNLYSIDKDNYIGKTEDQLLPEEFAESCMESDRQAVARRGISKSEERARDEEDILHYYEVFKVPSYDRNTDKFSGLIGVGRDITERKEAQEALEKENAKRKEHEEMLAQLTQTLESKVKERTLELEKERTKAVELSYRDDLTQINNRRAYYEKSESVDQNARNKCCSYTVIVLDIDHFKFINDTYGHTVGDMVLKSISNILSHNLRSEDIEGRIGGDEFAITLIDTTMDDALNIANDLREKMTNITFEKHEKLHITVSFGVAQYRKDSKTFEDVLSIADAALYEAKGSGKNTVCSKT